MPVAVATKRQLLPPLPSSSPNSIGLGPHHDGTSSVGAELEVACVAFSPADVQPPMRVATAATDPNRIAGRTVMGFVSLVVWISAVVRNGWLCSGGRRRGFNPRGERSEDRPPVERVQRDA